MKKSKLIEQKSIIMDSFDFVSVHEVFKHLGIKIKTDKPEKPSIPSLNTIKRIAEKCMDVVVNSDDDNVNCEMCGFEAEKKENLVELRFVLVRVNALGALLGDNSVKKTAKFS